MLCCLMRAGAVGPPDGTGAVTSRAIPRSVLSGLSTCVVSLWGWGAGHQRLGSCRVPVLEHQLVTHGPHPLADCPGGSGL